MIDTSRVCFVLFLLLFTQLAFSQSRKALEEEKARLQEEIKLTNRDIKTTAKNIDAALKDVKALEAEVNTRKKMLNTLDTEMNMLDNELESESDRLTRAEQELQDLKENYTELLRQAYISKQTENPILFLLSAQNMNQAFQRWIYLRQLEKHRNRQYDLLLSRQDSIRVIVDRIGNVKQEKTELKGSVEQQQKKFNDAAAAKESLVKKLKKDESALKKRLSEQEAESKRLADEIDRIIKEEIAKKSSAAGLPDAPALAALTSSFQENKGKIPWPVEKGIITGKFGTQPHPVLKSIQITNNGIDFTVEKGSKVMAVFDGVVVGRKFIPGFDEMVIIQHGKFYTVYSKLAQASVNKGDKVRIRQVIGKVSSEENKAELHFELWEEKSLQDPETWIIR